MCRTSGNESLRSDRLEQRASREGLSPVRTCQEFLRVDIAFEQLPLHQRPDGCLDHHRWSAQIRLVSTKIATEVCLRCFMNEASEACPRRTFRLIRQRRHIGEILVMTCKFE